MAEKKLEVVVGVRNNVRAGMQGVENDLGSSLKRLKGSLGEESTLGLGLKTLQGAGAAAAINLVGQMGAQATGKMIELRKELDAGAISAGEMAEKLAGSLPIFGGIWQTGRNIRELVTGEEAAAERIRKEAEQTNGYLAARAAIMQRAKKDAEELAVSMREMGQQAALLAMPESQRESAGAEFAATNRAAKIRDEYKAEIDARTVENQKKIDDADKAEKAIIIPEAYNASRDSTGRAVRVRNQKEIDEALSKQRAARDKVNTLTGERDKETKRLEAERDQKLAAEALTAQRQQADIQRKVTEGLARERRAAEDRIAADEGAVRQDRLRRWKGELDADLDAVRSELARRAGEIEQRRDDTLKGLGERNDPTGAGRQQVNDQSERELKAARDRAAADEDGARGRDAERQSAAEKERQARQENVGRSLRQMGADYLEQEAAAGRISRLEVDRLRIAEEFNQKRRELQAIMADEATSLEQRATAMRQFQGLGRQEAEAKQRAAADGPNRFASASESRGTGAGALAREQSLTKANKLEQLNVEQNRHLVDAKELLRTGFDALKTLTGQLVTAFSGAGYSGTGNG